MDVVQYLIARAKEASSYAGAVSLMLAALHVSANPTLVNAALAAVAALGSLAAILVPEKSSAPTVAPPSA